MAYVSYAREAREPHTPVGRVRRKEKKLFFFERLSPVSLSVFSLVPDLLFDCSRVLEYAIIRTVLQSKFLYPDGLTPPASLKHILMSVMSFFNIHFH